MPALALSMVRAGRGASPAWLTPAQRVVRVLQVTQANWPVLPGGGRKRRHGGLSASPSAPLHARAGESLAA